MGWLIYVQALLFGVILLRAVVRPLTRKRQTARAERIVARILRESRAASPMRNDQRMQRSLRMSPTD